MSSTYCAIPDKEHDINQSHVAVAAVATGTDDVDSKSHGSPEVVDVDDVVGGDKARKEDGLYPNHLHPSHGRYIQRIPSPDALSEISVGENGMLWPGRRSIAMQPLSSIRSRSAGRSRPETKFETWLNAFWLRNKGLAYVLLAQVFGVLMNVTTRILELEGNNGKGLHPFQVLFARMGITVIFASAYMYWKQTPDFPFGARGIRPLLVARGLGGFFGVFGMYYSLLYLPLADATVITFLAPGIACWACSYILKEPFTRMEQIAAYVSLFGVVLIARPTSLFTIGHGHIEPSPLASGDGDVSSAVNGTSPTIPSSAYDLSNITAEQRAKGVAVAMLGVLGAASAFTTLRWIGRRAHPLISVNYFATWCTIVSTVMMFALPGVGFLLPANFKEWCYLFFLGICGFIMQFLLASGLQYEKGSRATNMVYTQMLFALGFDKLIFGTVPGWTSIIGSSLILGSAIYVAVQKDVAASGRVAPATSYVSVDQGDEETGQLETNGLGDLMDSDSDGDGPEHGITSSATVETR